MQNILNTLLQDLSYSRQRELIEELLATQSLSDSDQEFTEQLLNKHIELLAERKYNDRLNTACKSYETFKERTGDPSTVGKENKDISSVEHQQDDQLGTVHMTYETPKTKTEKRDPSTVGKENKQPKGKRSKLKHGYGIWPGTYFFPEWNYTRLLILRIKRELDSVGSVFKSDIFKNTIDKTNIGFSIIGVAWYLPRFSRLTTLITKHAIKDKSADYYRKYWFHWFNDLMWIVTGAITLGISTHWYLGSTAAIFGAGGIILTVALYVFDVLNAAIKAYTKLRKIDRIIENIDKQIQTLESSQGEGVVNANEKTVMLPHVVKGDNSKDLEAYKKLKEKLLLRRSFIKRDQCVKVGVTVGLLAGMLLMLSNSIGIFVGASIVLVTCALCYYANRSYLPKKEVQYNYEPLALLHESLIKHTESQITRFDKVKNPNEKTTNKKTEYERVYTSLKEWQNTDARNMGALLDLTQETMNASLLTRKRFVPRSYKNLKTSLKPFLVEWSKDDKLEQDFKTKIKDFISHSKPRKLDDVISVKSDQARDANLSESQLCQSKYNLSREQGQMALG